MLKRFTVENFSSYQEENSLDLTAGKTEVNSSHLVNFKKVKILKSAILYGANASGKSNLIKAINYAKNIILKSLDDVDTYKKYFKLDTTSLNKPTVFEFELELNNKFFSYGFSSILNSKKISEEWLYEIGKNTPELIFTREKNKIKLGKSLIKSKRFGVYVDDMKNQSDQLFLSEIANKDLDLSETPEATVIDNIYKWFDEKLIIIYPDTTLREKSLIGKSENISKMFKKYLNEFDTGVVDISCIEEDFEEISKNLPNELKELIEKNLNKKDVNMNIVEGSNGELLTIYKDDDGKLKVQKLGLIHNININEIFELKDESDGTRRLFDLIPLIGKFSRDFTIIIDEFDRSLHPKLTKQFFKLFYELNDENSKTQLIVTTHESTLLDLDLVRRDEIWFVEKDNNGASKLFSLNEFNIRYDSKIEKAYLLGRYGAIPIFKTFDEIDLDN